MWVLVFMTHPIITKSKQLPDVLIQVKHLLKFVIPEGRVWFNMGNMVPIRSHLIQC